MAELLQAEPGGIIHRCRIRGRRMPASRLLCDTASGGRGLRRVDALVDVLMIAIR